MILISCVSVLMLGIQFDGMTDMRAEDEAVLTEAAPLMCHTADLDRQTPPTFCKLSAMYFAAANPMMDSPTKVKYIFTAVSCSSQ